MEVFCCQINFSSRWDRMWINLLNLFDKTSAVISKFWTSNENNIINKNGLSEFCCCFFSFICLGMACTYCIALHCFFASYSDAKVNLLYSFTEPCICLSVCLSASKITLKRLSQISWWWWKGGARPKTEPFKFWLESVSLIKIAEWAVYLAENEAWSTLLFLALLNAQTYKLSACLEQRYYLRVLFSKKEKNWKIILAYSNGA